MHDGIGQHLTYLCPGICYKCLRPALSYQDAHFIYGFLTFKSPKVKY